MSERDEWGFFETIANAALVIFVIISAVTVFGGLILAAINALGFL